MATSVMWFRRDLRLNDSSAVAAALQSADDVVPLFVLDDRLRGNSGTPRLAFMYRALRALDESLGGRLVVRTGDPGAVVPAVAREVEASSVFCTGETEPYGSDRDNRVEVAARSFGIELQRVDSPYAVEPGSILKTDGTPFAVFSPFSRAWQAHGWGRPQALPEDPRWADLQSESIPEDPKLEADLMPAGEVAALDRLDRFLERDAGAYRDARNDPGAARTSRLSVYLKFGCIHPRTILARLDGSQSAGVFRNELCWREFYADVLFHHPESLGHSLQPRMATMQLDEGLDADRRFEAWGAGQTGYPLVDAGMRQLRAEAYMHNRVRMVVASFLVKDLHIDWTRGADFFMEHLQDGDLASNAHGWQWVAGTGTDAAPYFRVFNPTLQAKKFDPDGVYIRRWVPELRNLPDKLLFEPWKAPGGPPDGYPAPIVDHGEERAESLRRYAALG